MKITNSQLKRIVKEELQAALNEQADANEWVGLSYREVSSKLKAMGVKPRGKWWRKYKYSHPARKKYRQWYKNRGKAKKAATAGGEKSKRDPDPAIKMPKGYEDRSKKTSTWPEFGAMMANREKLGIKGQPGKGAFDAPDKWYHGLHRDEAMDFLKQRQSTEGN
jgi:hypothetical protein